MKKKAIKYSIVSEHLGLDNEKSLKNGQGDSLAALTHCLQARDSGSSNYLVDRVSPEHSSLWNELVIEGPRRSGRTQNQIAIPGLLSAEVKYDVPFPPPKDPKFRFIDLFAGIGGMRLAFQNAGGECVFSSEIDPFAKKTYQANFGEVPFGDITAIDENEIPDHDVLVGGFPCQAFSIAGKRLGFEEARGTLFFDVARILHAKKPAAIFLENVKGLMNHKGGDTLRVILKILREDLGYFVPDPKIVNAKYFGVPQNRERVFIVGFRDKKAADAFAYPAQDKVQRRLSDILEERPVPSKYYLSTRYLESMREHRRRHEAKGHGFGYEIIPKDGIANAIVVGGMGRERNLVIDNRLTDRTPTTNIVGEINHEFVRRMTPREWARLQGYPDKFRIVVSDAQAYKQFGNSVAVPAVLMIGKTIVKSIVLSNQ